MNFDMGKIKSILAALVVAAAAASCNTGEVAGTTPVPRPAYLQPGDTVGIMLLSSPVAERRSEADSLIDIVRSWGVNVKLGEHLFKLDYPPFNVTDQQRAQEFMDMVKDDNVKAIVFYRGGYGAIRTMDYLDFDEIRKHPKWIVGYSDVTTLHLALQRAGMESVHAAMLNSYWMTRRPDSAAITVSDALFGRLKGYHINPHPYNKLGEVTGKIVGGNMTLISIAEGTSYNLPVDDNTILFIEEVGENMNAVDGMMQQLKKSGKLGKAKAVLVGNMTRIRDDEDPWNITPQELIKRYTDELDVPVVFGFPSGHSRPNYAIYLGREVHLSVREDGVDLKFL